MLLIESSTGEACFPFAGMVPLSGRASYIDHRMATLRVGSSAWAMKAQLARFVIFQIAMLIALVFFMTMDAGWLPAVLTVGHSRP
jgi:hypothetical protein